MLLLGKKHNMTQVFDENGRCHPVTVVSVGPMTVVQVKNKENDGYNAIQFGFDKLPLERVGKPASGKFIGSLGGAATAFRHLRELRIEEEKLSEFKNGDVITPDSVLKEGDKVVISSVSKGKGFQSAIKRHGFKGGPRSHGQKHCERAPGSIGGGLRNKVPKGMRMAGRMGADRVTVKGVSVVKVDTENGLILLKGAIPGRRGTLVEIVSK